MPETARQVEHQGTRGDGAFGALTRLCGIGVVRALRTHASKLLIAIALEVPAKETFS